MSQSIFIKGIFPSFSLFFTHTFGGDIPISSRQWGKKKNLICFISNNNLLSVEGYLTTKVSFLIVLLLYRHGKLLGNEFLPAAKAWHLQTELRCAVKACPVLRNLLSRLHSLFGFLIWFITVLQSTTGWLQTNTGCKHFKDLIKMLLQTQESEQLNSFW